MERHSSPSLAGDDALRACPGASLLDKGVTKCEDAALPRQVPQLFLRARAALFLTQVELARLLGASRRTGQRWDSDKSTPSPQQLQTLAKHIYPVDPQLAAEIAQATDTTLVALGLAPPPPPANAPPPPPVASIVDSVVCAAAEAIDVVPRAVRPALLAAFSRARELQLTIEVVEKALLGKPAPKSEKATKS